MYSLKTLVKSSLLFFAFMLNMQVLHAEYFPKHDDLFQLDNQTKNRIGTIIKQLESEQGLTMHDPIGKYLTNIPERWKNVTIRQLLNHTSGIYNYSDTKELWTLAQEQNFNKQWTSDELIQLVQEKPLYFSPGESFHYSNTNYLVAVKIIESITGRVLEEEIKGRIDYAGDMQVTQNIEFALT